MESTGQSLDEATLKSLSKAIREPMWKWHNYLGFALIGLFAIRFTLPFFDKMNFQNPLEGGISRAEKIKRWIYIIFYFCVVISLITGILIEYGPPSLKKAMKLIHKPSVYYLVPFIIIHLGSVLLAEFTKVGGIISSIISGRNEGNNVS